MHRRNHKVDHGPGQMAVHDTRNETGLLTRCVPPALKHSRLYRLLLRLARVLQFLSATISLGIFSSRVYKIYRLTNSFRASYGVNRTVGAVEGILAAAAIYTLISMIMTFVLRGGGPKWLRWFWVLCDVLFVGAFIAVSILTSPNGGYAGPKHCYENRDASNPDNLTGAITDERDETCNLPWGTFILAIISTVLHALTAAFHEVRDRYKQHHGRLAEENRMARERQRHSDV